MTDVVDFILQNGGPIARNVLLTELGETKSNAYRANREALLASDEVAYWRDQIPSVVDSGSILGSSDSCVENSLGKLIQYRLEPGDYLSRALVRAMLRYLETEGGGFYGGLSRYLIAGYLALAGVGERSVWSALRDRLDRLQRSCARVVSTSSTAWFDIYEDSAVNLERGSNGKRAVKPELYADQFLDLPLVHDLFFFARLRHAYPPRDTAKIDAVLDFVLDDRYQALDYGYGVMRGAARGGWHSIGWSAHLPFFHEGLASAYFEKGLLHRYVCLSSLRPTFRHPNLERWLSGVEMRLRPHRGDNGLYALPNQLLPEVKDSYFMNGRHMGLGENRRTRTGRSVDSSLHLWLAGAPSHDLVRPRRSR